MKTTYMIELAYSFRKLGGADNLLLCIDLLSGVVHEGVTDEKVLFMLALAYRRCCHINVYTQNPEKIDREKFSKESERIFQDLGETSLNESIKAAACLELAELYIQDEHQEYISTGMNKRKKCTELCSKALGISNSSERVLKLAGEILNHFQDTREEAIRCLRKAIQLQPSSRAWHHLGMAYSYKANEYEAEYAFQNEVQKTYSEKGLMGKINCMLQYPEEILQPFSPGNKYVEYAEEYLTRACEISFASNTESTLDLAYLLARKRNYSKAKFNCQEIIRKSEKYSSSTEFLCFVPAGLLYGLICAMECKEADTKEKATCCLQKSEKMFSETVRKIKGMLAKVSNVKPCLNDLLDAITHLREVKQMFADNEQAMGKFCKLCQQESSFSKIRKRKYSKARVENNESGDSDLSETEADSFDKEKESKVCRQDVYIQHDRMYQYFKTLFHQTFPGSYCTPSVTGDVDRPTKTRIKDDSQAPEVLIIETFDEDYRQRRDSWSGRATTALKEMFAEKFGITAKVSDDVNPPGSPILDLADSTVNFPVVIFVLGEFSSQYARILKGVVTYHTDHKIPKLVVMVTEEGNEAKILPSFVTIPRLRLSIDDVLPSHDQHDFYDHNLDIDLVASSNYRLTLDQAE